jgi:hypothetical protein
MVTTGNLGNEKVFENDGKGQTSSGNAQGGKGRSDALPGSAHRIQVTSIVLSNLAAVPGRIFLAGKAWKCDRHRPRDSFTTLADAAKPKPEAM